MFKLDLRSVALFRQLLALVGMVDLALRAGAIHDFYSDQGVAPRVLAMTLTEKWSLHFISGSPYFQWVLFLIHGFFLYSLWVGWKPKLSSFFVWGLTLSMHARLEIINDGGDSIYRHLLFWSILLPADGHFRVLAFEPVKRVIYRFRSISSIGFFWLAVSIYTFSGYSKILSPLWVGKIGVLNGLWADAYVSDFGQKVRTIGMRPLQFLNDLTVYLELLGVWLLLVPDQFEIANRRVNQVFSGLRYLVILSFLGLHAAIVAQFSLGTFPWICMAMWTVFLPSGFWERFPLMPLMRHLFPNHAYASVSRPSSLRLESGFSWFESKGGGESLKLLLGRFGEIVAVVSVVIGILWNLNTADGKRFPIPQWARVLTLQLGMEQGWNLFIYSENTMSWLSIVGKFSDGSIRELWYVKDLPSVKSRPPRVAALYPSQRWREVNQRVMWTLHEHLFPYYGAYVCREHPGLRSFIMTQYMQFVTSQVEGRYAPVTERPRGEYTCIHGALTTDKGELIAFKMNQK
jgi:hypothetical protein